MTTISFTIEGLTDKELDDLVLVVWDYLVNFEQVGVIDYEVSSS